MPIRVKVCGMTTAREAERLGGLGVDWVGLWHGVEGGRADLSLDELSRLADRARAIPGVEPVLVTSLSDPQVLREVVLSSGIYWVQLHAYQMPAAVRALKDSLFGAIRVIKVLHVDGPDCLERALVGAYERAGVDLFLLDAVTRDGRSGSTGESLDPRAVTAIADRLSTPFLLAGDISPQACESHRASIGHPRFRGVDVDTHARGPHGEIDPAQVLAIQQAWGAVFDE